MFEFQEERGIRWRQLILMLAAGMVMASLITLGAAFLTLHRNCYIEFYNTTPDIVCADDTTMGWLLIVTGVFFSFTFAAYYKLFELQSLQTL